VRQGLFKAVVDVACQEEEAAIKIHPLFNSTHEGYAVILEELQEAKEGLEKVEALVDELWHSVRNNSFDSFRYRDNAIINTVYLYDEAVKLACEVIQIAAMANKFVESIKTKDEKTKNPDEVIDPRD
jgi:tetrahydromethanopterin S-methyltransferase subunit B